MATITQLESIAQHGRKLLAIFPNATERDPVTLCKKLRRLEGKAAQLALRACNGPSYATEDEEDQLCDAVVAKVNALLGNVNEYQPKTGAKCGCRRGVQRDNCSSCEGTGMVVDFAAIRSRKPIVPVFVNLDARGYSLKIPSEYVAANRLDIHTDWGEFGILAPEITE